MSILLRLLTTGKSLIGVRDEVHRYRTTNHRLLPCFGSDKNPFQTHSEAPDKLSSQISTHPQVEQVPSSSKGSFGRRLFFSTTAKPIAKPSPARQECPVQGELSLDRVQVVRNDLSDVDLEVVPLRSTAKSRPAAAAMAHKNEPVAEEPPRVLRATNRLFGLLKA